MASGFDFPTFYDRFEDLRRRLRRHLGWQVLTVLAMCSLLGFVVISGLDYYVEIPWLLRAVSLAALSTAGLLVAGWALAAGSGAWSRNRTAAAIERKFPELGQRVRTTVEYRGRSQDQLKAGGVAPGLVRALESEAAVSTLPLPLEDLIPARRLIVLAVLTVSMTALVGGAGLWNGEWHTAMRRTLLADESFTRLSLITEDTTVDKGTALRLKALVQGRARDSVILRTRPASRGGSAWDQQLFNSTDAEPMPAGEWAYDTLIANITEPFEFQWSAGPEQSRVHRIDVRYPLQILAVSVDVTPPQYTGLPAVLNTDGNLNVLEGSQAKFTLELDGVPATASVALSPKSKSDDFDVEVIQPRIEGSTLHFEATLGRDVNWAVEATSPHGLPLAENSYRIRVRKDQPPTVAFEEPSDALDVHSLAEILMRIRARDDFGLIRAGIVFQINNDEEHTLFAEDYQAAVDELQSTGHLTPRTSAALERTLPLEHFKLIQKDAITYYAFAEDNRPGSPQRIESELRFIDIRPFKTIYRQQTAGAGGGEGGTPGPRRATFEELIGRQRSALNRTLSMRRNSSPDLGGLDRLMKFEGAIAELTNGLAQFLKATAERFNIEALFGNADLLFQAERAMLDSVDSMSVGKFDIAMLQEKDAIRFLVESRDRLEVLLDAETSPDGVREAVNDYFRQQQTKLRRKPKQGQDAQEKGVNLLEQLAQLAARQSMVAAQLDSISGDPEAVSAETSPASTADPESAKTEKDRSDPDTRSDRAVGPGSGGPTSSDRESAGGGVQTAARTGMTREEISAKQREIASDAADAQKELMQLEQASELAKRRMGNATELAESASQALERGNSKAATVAANDAAEKFEQLLTLAQGLLAAELPDQLNAARDLADDISRREEDLANMGTPKALSAKQGQSGPETVPADDKERLEAIARQAEKLAAAAGSLADILNRAINSTTVADKQAVLKVTDLIEKGGVAAAIERIQRQAQGIRSGKIDEEKKAAVDIADKMDEAARKLDAIQREIVNPIVAGLLKLEAKAKELEVALDEIESNRQAQQWHETAEEFLEQLNVAEAGVTADEELKREMQAGGWDPSRKALRTPAKGLASGETYKKALRGIAAELRERVQQLMLTELTVSGEETPPARYEGMVTKYQRTLTMGVKGNETKRTKAMERRSGSR